MGSLYLQRQSLYWNRALPAYQEWAENVEWDEVREGEVIAAVFASIVGVFIALDVGFIRASHHDILPSLSSSSPEKHYRCTHINSLAPGRFEWNFRYIIFKWILVIDGWGISCEIALILMSLDLTDDQSTLVQVIAWCRQATSHYLSQCWPRYMLSYDVTRLQWVNLSPPGRNGHPFADNFFLNEKFYILIKILFLTVQLTITQLIIGLDNGLALIEDII